jgi:Flp pilus assembly protein TadG
MLRIKVRPTGFPEGMTPRRPARRGGRRSRGLQRGQAMLEILIVMIFLVPLIFGGIELSRGVAVRAALDSGVGVAARALAIDPTQWSWAATVVDQTVQQNVLGTAGIGIVHLEAYDSAGTQIDSSIQDLSYGAPFSLVGWVTYAPEIPLISLSPPSMTIRVRHFGVIERID